MKVFGRETTIKHYGACSKKDCTFTTESMTQDELSAKYPNLKCPKCGATMRHGMERKVVK